MTQAPNAKPFFAVSRQSRHLKMTLSSLILHLFIFVFEVVFRARRVKRAPIRTRKS
jgi:hypothetical protein